MGGATVTLEPLPRDLLREIRKELFTFYEN